MGWNVGKSAVERFWLKVKKTPTCWLWVGACSPKERTPDGRLPYGMIMVSNCPRVMEKAHRFSFRMFVRPIPKGKKVLHHCDNSMCVRPSHLFLGTQKDNVVDCIKKGRFFFVKAKSGSSHFMNDPEKKKKWLKARWVSETLETTNTLNMHTTYCWRGLRSRTREWSMCS
jgi:hypothetical protein